jgi:carbon monoxide dehydrogenase subunit G
MELTNEFEVAISPDEAWSVLTDVERIAPCLPGAELKEIEGDKYRGVVKVKVGPITATYQGVAHFEELDEVARRAVLKADGRETRGQGNASATITATLSPSDLGTKVRVATDLAITGKVAQFARGTLAEVSGKLLDQFVQNLETMVLSPTADAGVDHAEEPKPKAEPKPRIEPDVKAEAKTRAAPEGKADAKTRAEPEGKAEAKTRAEPEGKADAKAKVEPEGKADAKAKVEPEGKAEYTADAGPVAAGAEPQGDAAAEPEPSTATVRQVQSVPAEPVDLVGIAGPSIARRILPFASIAGGLFLARIIVYALRRRKS